MEKKPSPRLVAVLEDQAALQEMLRSRGWKVVEGIVRQVQRLATSVLKQEKEPQALFQAQGTLIAFERMWSTTEQLRDASEEDLVKMIEEEESK